jgi:uncharacterized repeat protein (TIGR03803 family)
MNRHVAIRYFLWLILALLPARPGAHAQVADFSFLYHFGTNADGFDPTSTLLQAANGNFYGTAAEGGANASGTVFSVSPAGEFTTLYTFSTLGDAGANSDGAAPAALVQGGDGNFYGTTALGGANGYGTFFRLTASGALTVLHTFTGGAGSDYPPASLILGTDGNFYGITPVAFESQTALVDMITPDGTVTDLYTFPTPIASIVNRALIQGADGNFYGTTSDASAASSGEIPVPGTVFKITPAGVFTTVYDGRTYSANPNKVFLPESIIQGP